MEKTILEKRIEEKAIERFNMEYKKWLNYNLSSPFKYLCVHVGECKEVNLFTFGGNYAIFNENGSHKINKSDSFEQIKNELIKKYIAEETDAILSKLTILEDYLK